MTPAERALAAVEQLLLSLEANEITYGQFMGGVKVTVAAWRRETT